MIISVSLLLYLYIAFVALFVVFSFFHVYHLVRFVAPSAGVYTMILFYIAGSFIIFGVTMVFFSGIDWTASVDLGSFNAINAYD